jgi:hypothetical protein
LGSGVPGPLTSAGSGIVASGMGGYGPGGAAHVGSGDNRGMPGISAGGSGTSGNDGRPPGSSSGNTQKSSALPQLNLKGSTSNAGQPIAGTSSISGISSVNGNTGGGSGVNGVGDATPRTTARDATKRRTYAPTGATVRAADAATAGKLPVASGGRGGTTYINKRGTYEGGPLSPHAPPPQSARASGDKPLASHAGSTASGIGVMNNGATNNDDISASDFPNTPKQPTTAATQSITSRVPNTDRGSLAPSSTERARENTGTSATSSAAAPISSSSGGSGGGSGSGSTVVGSNGVVVSSGSGSGSTSRTSRGAARTTSDRVAKPPVKVRQPMTPAG